MKPHPPFYLCLSLIYGLEAEITPEKAIMLFSKSLLPSEDQGFIPGQIYLPGFFFSQEIVLKAPEGLTLPVLLFQTHSRTPEACGLKNKHPMPAAISIHGQMTRLGRGLDIQVSSFPFMGVALLLTTLNKTCFLPNN